MRCWIAVNLHRLPLQALRPRWSEPLPLAIVDSGQVIAMNSMAAAQGARIGMRGASVQAIAPEVLLQQRDPLLEQQTLDAVALALMQYTPEIAAADERSLLLEVSASLMLFGGHRRLSRRVRHSVHALGLSVVLGMAPTAQGAWLLACRRSQDSSPHRHAIQVATMRRRLDALPFQRLPEAARHAEWLDGIGCRTLADLHRLPRTGLKRRTQGALLDALDRAYGEAPELFDWLQAPESFSASVELPYRIDDAPMLLFAAQRLLAQMTGWLVAQQQAVSRFVLWLTHERGRARRDPSSLEIVLSEPAWQEAHLMRLLKERLNRLPLVAPVVGLRLEATQLSAWSPSTTQLFAEPGGTAEDYHRLLELLVARLGTDAIQLPSPRADYRPERANQWQPIDVSHTNKNTKKNASTPAILQTDMPAASRPFWLLEPALPLVVREHRPFYGSSLRLLSGPERIEAGWWDGALALRDYFVAQGEEGACYWVYRERDAGSARWFLHGLFG
jgi:protein ImuB